MYTPPDNPLIGIVGSAGAYGLWLRRFFAERMALQVVGSDPADPASLDLATLVARADVLLFAAPIRLTEALIEHCVALAGGAEAGKLWLDVTSIKQAPVSAMLRSQADVVGLHPMTAPPKSPTLKGRVMVVCEARLSSAWRPWFERLQAALEPACVQAAPAQHDRVMALVQSMVHATHLAQAGVLREQAAVTGDLSALMPFRSASFEMDAAIISRILSLNPAIYEDIQFGNPHSLEVLQSLLLRLQRLAELVASGDEAARTAFRQEFLQQNRDTGTAAALAEGNYTFERIGYLLADLGDPLSVSVHLPEDRPGSLRELLHVFERNGVNITSLHSSRTQAGEVHFRLGFGSQTSPGQVQASIRALAEQGIARVLAGENGAWSATGVTHS